MALKDSVFSWFIQYIIEPKIQKIDLPGFIIVAVSGEGKETYRRALLLEEDLLCSIENKIAERYGNKGKQALYSAGKKFGYNYASLSNFTQLDSNKKEFLNFVYFLTRYITTIYASAADYKVDLNAKQFVIQLKDYIVCSKDGLGYVMADGGIAGIWAYMINDKTVEGVQEKCQGRKNELCIVTVKGKKQLDKDGIPYFIETDIEELEFDDQYKKLNLARETEYAQNSLKDLLDAGFFEYDKGSIRYKNMRYALVDSNILYILENEICKLPHGNKELFDACFEHGQYLQEIYGDKDYRKFISDYFPALGWGDVFVLQEGNKLSVTANYYPWSIHSEKSGYIILRGVMSGFISSCLQRKIILKELSNETTDYLAVTISQ